MPACTYEPLATESGALVLRHTPNQPPRCVEQFTGPDAGRQARKLAERLNSKNGKAA